MAHPSSMPVRPLMINLMMMIQPTYQMMTMTMMMMMTPPAEMTSPTMAPMTVTLAMMMTSTAVVPMVQVMLMGMIMITMQIMMVLTVTMIPLQECLMNQMTVSMRPTAMTMTVEPLLPITMTRRLLTTNWSSNMKGMQSMGHDLGDMGSNQESHTTKSTSMPCTSD